MVWFVFLLIWSSSMALLDITGIGWLCWDGLNCLASWRGKVGLDQRLGVDIWGGVFWMTLFRMRKKLLLVWSRSQEVLRQICLWIKKLRRWIHCKWRWPIFHWTCIGTFLPILQSSWSPLLCLIESRMCDLRTWVALWSAWSCKFHHWILSDIVFLLLFYI